MTKDSSNQRRFRFGQILALEETRNVEFKEIKGSNLVGAITNVADEYAVSFLNSEGGRVYWGIQDSDHRVVGVRLGPEQRDELRKKVMGKLQTILPHIDPTRFKIELHHVEDSKVEDELFVVELVVPAILASEPFFTSGNEVFVRTDGVKQKLVGPQIVDWIRRRAQTPPVSADPVTDLRMLALVHRVRQLFAAHGLEPTQLGRFLSQQRAPFSIAFTDIQTDGALLAWLDSDKIDWISQTFLIRREWIEGEDDRIHEDHSFDKQPERFFATISKHTDALIYQDLVAQPLAYFIQWGLGSEWKKRGESRVFVVVAVPLAQMSNERTVYKHICEFNPSPWDYGRTNIELRAWARLLFVNKSIPCYGRAVSYKTGEKLWSNSLFLPELLDDFKVCQRIDWSPEDYALYPTESTVAKDTDSLPRVIEFLRSHNLPWERTTLCPPKYRTEGSGTNSDVVKQYEGKRLKVRGRDKMDQFFVAEGQLRYLEPSAAMVCDEANIAYIEIEPDVMQVLAAARGSDLNAVQMRSILQRRGS